MKERIGEVMGGRILQLESERLEEEGVKKGIKRGREEGIEVLVLDNLEEGRAEEKIIQKLQKHFALDEERAEMYYRKFSGRASH